MCSPPVAYEQLPHQKILCVDMKSFFASTEAAARGLDPLKTCLAVVGDKEREGSVILAASPALKEKYGIKTGSRLYEVPAKPEIKIINARMELYLQRSMEITRLLNEFVPLEAIHVYSIDESWIKLDGTERLFGDNREVACRIKQELMKRYRLSCSMGIGPNMFLSKVAMDTEGKKKGLVEWTYEDVSRKLWPLKLSDCWGIGSRLEKKLNRIGVKTVGDLAHLPLEYLERKWGIMGNQLYYHAWGVDLSRVEGHYRPLPKSLGRGITLLRDYQDEEEIETVIFELAETVARRTREHRLLGKTVSLGLGYSKDERENGFHVQRTLKEYTNLADDIYNTCMELMEENYGGQAARKINVALGNFTEDTDFRLNLFYDRERKLRISQVKDRIEHRYGRQAIFYGRSLKKGSIRMRINTTIGGHKT